MRWVLLDVAIALVALLLLAVVLLRLWRRVKAVAADVGAAGDRIETATRALEEAQATALPRGPERA